jgi:hypothetical protein
MSVKIVHAREVPSFTPRKPSRHPSTALPLLSGLAGAAKGIEAKTKIRVTTLYVHRPPEPIRIISQDAFRGVNALPGSREDLVNRGILSGKPPKGSVTTIAGTGFGQDDTDDTDTGSGLSLTELAGSGTLDDNTLLNSVQGQASSLLAASGGSLYTDGEQVWHAALAGAATGAGIGIAASALGAILSQVGFEALSDLLATLVSAIATAITEALAAVGAADVIAATAAGGSFGYVGAVIGAIIGACIALGNILYGGQHCQITDGRTYSCKDYVQNNVQNACNWVNQNPHMLTGLTVVAFAQMGGLFYAQPTWMYRNQGLLGANTSWGPPPDPGSGDALDMVYTEVPGAYEILNRAQFLAACALVNSTPQHLNFYKNIYKPVLGQAFIQDEVSGVVSPGTKYGTAVYGQGVYPDPTPENGWQATPTITNVAWGIGDKTDASVVSGGTSPGWLYTACPHMMTNNNVFTRSDGSTFTPTFQNPHGLAEITGTGASIASQTDACPGIYNLQVLYPSLTTKQCEKIFAKCSTAYSTVAQTLVGDLSSTSGTITTQGPTRSMLNYMRSHGHAGRPPTTVFVKPGIPYTVSAAKFGKIIMAPIPTLSFAHHTTVEAVTSSAPSNVGPAVGSLGLGAVAGLGAAALGVPVVGAGAIGVVGAGTLFELLKKKT